MTPTTTVIVIVVCAAAGIVVAVVAYRTYRNRFVRNSRPLPPVQPIVSVRARNLADFEANTAYLHSQPDISLDLVPSTPNSAAPLVLNPSSSSVSLRTMEKAPFPINPGSGMSTPFSSEPKLAPYDRTSSAPLQPPSRATRRPDTAGSSHSSAPSASGSGSLSPFFASEAPSSATSHNTASPSPYSPSPSSSSLSGVAAARTHVRTTSKSRSVASATTDLTTRTASSGRLGLPHNPHSNVRVVLPAPLASDPALHAAALGETKRARPQNANASTNTLSVFSQSASRVSVADMWAPAVYRGVAGSADDAKAHDGVHLRNSSAPLAPSRLSNVSPGSRAERQGQERRRSSSSSGTAPVSSDLMPPPVPRVPSTYGKASMEHPPQTHLRQRSKSGPAPGELSMSMSMSASSRAA